MINQHDLVKILDKSSIYPIFYGNLSDLVKNTAF